MNRISKAADSLFNLALRPGILLGVLILAGCGGGADTTQLAASSLPATSNYTGPVPATTDVQAFMVNVWENLRSNNRCGACHSDDGGQSPMFARDDDVNLAYAAANPLVDLSSPPDSRLVAKVTEGVNGHNCWLSSPQACADILTTWISAWAGTAGSASGRQIQLVPPVIQDVGASKNFPPDAIAFAAPGGIHELLINFNCGNCHSASSSTPQTPFFADSDINVAFGAAKQKINLEDPGSSRLVVRLRDEFHNCPNDCTSDAAEMQLRIAIYSGAIPLTTVDPQLVISKALTLYDGTIASGGNRHETSQIAFYEFKTGAGTTAFDTSGVDPAIDLTLSGTVNWVGGWGIEFVAGKAQGSTVTSKKLHDLIKSTGEYTIEAWAVPGNVSQEEARIVSYSAGTAARNFNLGQTLYNYDFFNRSSVTDGNGSPALSTADADEDLQATLQHVVMTNDPVNGRRIYVNTVFTDDLDAGGGTLADWDDTFAFVLGNEVSGDRQWLGTLRMVSIHNRVLTQAQIQQNFDVGVGEKFFLLFFVGDLVNMPQAYIVFEVSQFDSYSYLFNTPVFVSLDPTATPGNIPIQGMRIGINGSEATVGQAYGNLDTSVTDSSYTPAGQPLSDLGTIIGLETGPATDEFFLTFEVLGSETNAFTEPVPLVPAPVDGTPMPDIGIRTFEEINATMSALTGIPTTNAAVKATYDRIRQQLPGVESIETFAAAHEMAIAQLAIEYCNALVNNPSTRDAYFPDFDFTLGPALAFAGTDPLLINDRDDVIHPLIDTMMGIGLGSQPDFVAIRNEVGYIVTPDYTNLIDTLISTGNNSTQRTADITKAVCASVLGSAVTLVQ
jgi:hypothetical protein